MPVVFHRPHHRRAFLEVAGLGSAAVLVSAFGHAAPVAPPGDLHLPLFSDTHVPADRVNGHRGVDARFRPDGVPLTLRAVAGNRADDGQTSLLEWQK